MAAGSLDGFFPQSRDMLGLKSLKYFPKSPKLCLLGDRFELLSDVTKAEITLSLQNVCLHVLALWQTDDLLYLWDGSFSVHLGQYSSSVPPLSRGAPQNSLLETFLFSLYLLLLGSTYGFEDDLQIYLPVQIKSRISIQALVNCIREKKIILATQSVR